MAPGFLPVAEYARAYGAALVDVEVACGELGIDTTGGVPLNRDESIRQVLRQWAIEGNI